MNLLKFQIVGRLKSHMMKKIVISCLLSVCVLAGCSNYPNPELSNQNVASIEKSEQNDSLSDGEKMKLYDFREINYSPIDLRNSIEYKIPDFELENAECVMFGSIELKKSEKVTLTFQLHPNDSTNSITIGIIKDFTPDSSLNYEVEKIYSKSIDNGVEATFTSSIDSHYSISILGTMAGNVIVKNGKIIKH